MSRSISTVGWCVSWSLLRLTALGTFAGWSCGEAPTGVECRPTEKALSGALEADLVGTWRGVGDDDGNLLVLGPERTWRFSWAGARAEESAGLYAAQPVGRPEEPPDGTSWEPREEGFLRLCSGTVQRTERVTLDARRLRVHIGDGRAGEMVFERVACSGPERWGEGPSDAAVGRAHGNWPQLHPTTGVAEAGAALDGVCLL